MALRTSGGTGNYVRLNTAGRPTSNTNWAMACWFVKKADTNARGIIMAMLATGYVAQLRFEDNGDDITINTELTTSSVLMTPTIGEPVFALINVAGGGSNQATVYLRRLTDSSFTTATFTLSNLTTISDMVYGGDPFQAGMSGTVENCIGWNRALTLDEIEQQWLKRIPVVGHGSILHWITGLGSTVAQAATNVAGTTSGVVTVNGTVTLEDGAPISWGASPRLVDNVTLASDVDIAVPKASLVLTVKTPSVAVSDHKRIAVPKAALTITARAPAVRIAHRVAVPKAALSLTFRAPAISVTEVTAIAVPKAALTITTRTPSVSLTDHKLIAVPKAALSITPRTPTVVASNHITVEVPKAGLTITALAPDVLLDISYVIEVPKVGLALSMHAPTVIAIVEAVPLPVYRLVSCGPGGGSTTIVDRPYGKSQYKKERGKWPTK